MICVSKYVEFPRNVDLEPHLCRRFLHTHTHARRKDCRGSSFLRQCISLRTWGKCAVADGRSEERPLCLMMGMPRTGGPTGSSKRTILMMRSVERWPWVMVTESSLKQPRKASLKRWPWVMHEGDSEPCRRNIPGRGKRLQRPRGQAGGGFPPLQLRPVGQRQEFGADSK